MSAPDASRSLVGVVLAAGEGTRLRPLTWARPKALCPVGGVPLVDLAVQRARPVVAEVAVNVHAGRDAMVDHLARDPSIHVSIEVERALGTAGALGALRSWIDGRGVLVQNADAWCDADLGAFVSDWDGDSIRLLLAGESRFHPRSRVAAALMPWNEVRDLEAVPTGLYEVAWRRAHDRGELQSAVHEGDFVDCGTVADYLEANRLAVAEQQTAGCVAVGGSIVGVDALIEGTAVDSVVGHDAVVAGSVSRSVVWDGCEVAPHESLVDAVRFDAGRTVLVRR